MKLNDIVRVKFPVLDSSVIDEIVAHGKYAEVAVGEIIMDVGDRIKYVPLLISGSLKIVRTNENAQELLLYHLYAGNSCALSLTCCQAGKTSEIKAVVEEEAELIFIPAHFHEQWMRSNVSWQNLVFSTYQDRFNELLEVLDEVTFHKLDERLESYLQKQATMMLTHELKLTHAQIATDLNSSREVISRLLKQLEKQGQVILGRNVITLLGDKHHQK